MISDSLEFQNDELKEKFLNMLQTDEDIREEIIKIIISRYNEVKKQKQKQENEKQTRELLLQISEKEKELDFLTKKCEQLNKQLQGKNDECVDVRKQFEIYQNENSSVLEENDRYRKRYEQLEVLYNKYLDLGSDIHRSLHRVLSANEKACKSIELFIGYGTQESNLIALWEVIATKYEYLSECCKLDDLISIFEYFFNLHKEITYKTIEWSRPNIDEEYDERYHARTSDSNATGKIVKVILPGFSIGNLIRKKALVYVK